MIGVYTVGVHSLTVGGAIFGLLFVIIGAYYGIWRVEYRNQSFVVTPGGKRYAVEDIVSWRVGEDDEAEAGYQRHIELQFDRWYRRYMLFEEDISSQEFDKLLKLLHER